MPAERVSTMADFSDFTEREFDVLELMFSETADNLRHYPNELSPEDTEIFYVLFTQFRNDARAKRIWWAL